MKVIYTLFLPILILLSLMSCTKSKEIFEDKNYSRELFIESKKLILDYTDSLNKAQSKVEIENYLSSFEDKLLKTNNKFPSETDMKMTEGENDTLFMLTKKLLITKEKKLKKLTSSDTLIDSINSTP